MSSKIGAILSFIFVALFFFLSVDVICLQFSYSDLDSKGITLKNWINNLVNSEDLKNFKLFLI